MTATPATLRGPARPCPCEELLTSCFSAQWGAPAEDGGVLIFLSPGPINLSPASSSSVNVE